MRLVFLFLALACSAAGILFGALNPDAVRVDFYWFSLSASLGAVLLGAALAGALASGLVLYAGVIWPVRRQLRRARRSAASTTPEPPSDAARLEPPEPA